MARFTREAQVLASLNHPNIGAIHGLEEEDGVRALVLELIEGEDLSERIAKGPIPLEEALQIALQMAEALETAHEKGIIHRDLKPAKGRPGLHEFRAGERGRRQTTVPMSGLLESCVTPTQHRAEFLRNQTDRRESYVD